MLDANGLVNLIYDPSNLLGDPMGIENDDFRPAHVYQSESRVMTRSESAMTQRTMDDMANALVAMQRHLMNVPVSETTVNEVAQQLMAASQLRQTLQTCAPILQTALPQAGNARLTDADRQEIRGYYATGNYTQDQLAKQYQVSQGTVSNIVTDDDDKDA